MNNGALDAMFINYWAVGATFGETDMSKEFIKNGYWYDGRYENGDTKYEKLLDDVQINDLFILKSAFSQGSKEERKSVTRVKAIGIVKKKEKRHQFNVEWFNTDKITDLDTYYSSTISRVFKSEITDFIYNEYKKYISMNTPNNYINLLLKKKQIILQGAPGTGKTRLAQIIAQELTQNGGETAIIQFHPAYSYEDFVRGIIAETNENGQISYKVKNKILAEIAQKAQKNLSDSQKPIEILQEEKKEKTLFDNFKDYCIKIDIKSFNLGENDTKIYIVDSDELGFWYTGINWNNRNRMKFEDILKMYNNNINDRKQVIKMENISRLAKEHSSYFLKILQKFREFMREELENKPQKTENQNLQKIAVQNYVLIIDEINRANLPAVLGELIYALEYRGKPVNSLYEWEGSKEIVLPENLYIIGTMNTADRSVGHIDYAIRRRFAFLTISPDEQIIIHENAKIVFKKIKEIFEKHLSTEFSLDDIMIGHSYFLVQNDNELQTKLEYEIKPLLREYVKDGILTCQMHEIENINA